MDTQLHLNSTPFGSTEVPTIETMVKVVFDKTLKLCLAKWLDNTASVVLDLDIEECYGELAADCFRDILAADVGGPVTLSVVDVSGGLKTLVQMPKYNVEQSFERMQFTPVPAASPLERNEAQPNTSAAPVKKAPRPMNCWLIFRDAMHKKIKADRPELSVQEISKECSKVWRNFTPKQKKPWQDAAQSAKEEHKRMHPNYKYSPRRPGQKKKRQSLKAKQAAAAAAAIAAIADATAVAVTAVTTTAGTTELGAFNFASPPDMVAFDNDFSFEIDFGRDHTDVSNTVVNNFEQLTVSSPSDRPEQEGLLNNNEIWPEFFRQDHLYTELGEDLIMDEMANDDFFALRDGADINATLLPFSGNI